MGYGKGNKEKNIVITDSEKKKLDRDKDNAIQEKKRVQGETYKLKIEQEKIKESLEKELDDVKDSIEMFKKEEEAQKVKVNIVALKLKDAKTSLKAIKDDVAKELKDSTANLDKADNRNDALVKSFEKNIDKLKKQEVVLLKSIDGLKEKIVKSKQELTINQEKEIEKVKLVEINSKKIDVLVNSVKALEDDKDKLSKFIDSKLIVLKEAEENIDAIKDTLCKVNADILVKDAELKEVSIKVDEINAQVIKNQERSSYLADWANQLEIEKKANSNTNKKLRKREKALREANA
jgi:hypothetical protein